jgi:hypothetical protein
MTTTGAATGRASGTAAGDLAAWELPAYGALSDSLKITIGGPF